MSTNIKNKIPRETKKNKGRSTKKCDYGGNSIVNKIGIFQAQPRMITDTKTKNREA